MRPLKSKFRLKVLHFEGLVPDWVERLLDGFRFSLDIVPAAMENFYYPDQRR